MEKSTTRVGRLVLQIFILLLFYTICRLLFIYVNKSDLRVNSFSSLLNILWGGLRFDNSAIAYTNSLFIIMALLPFPFTTNKHFKKIMTILFVSINSLCLAANLIDIAYFPYIHKRSQADTLLFFTGQKGNDLFRLIPSFLSQYWHLLLTYILLVGLLYKAYQFTLKINSRQNPSFKSYLYSSIIFIVGITLAVIMTRGGLQTRPLNLIHASEAVEVKNIPAVINTPFSIIQTIERKNLLDVKYFPETELQHLNNGIHTQINSKPFTKQNVVIIIVESLSKKYIAYFGGKAQTPFLDSLFAQSLVFTNGFANAKESIQGIPAIISSIPSWQDDSFIFSPYSSNNITSLPFILKEQQYQTSFFHGGFNGTMGFDLYAKLAGFDQYYGRNEYGNEADYDGSWGIWDEPFLQFTAQKLSSTQQPFFSTVFTLNTHNPFVLPEKYKNRFNQSKEPLLNCISYLDYSLSRFFDSVKNQPWFANTLFVITADHTAPAINEEPVSSIDDYRIPIVFYKYGSTLKGASGSIANQIDILPSILSLLDFNHPYYSIGTSLFEPAAKRFSINYNSGTYQYIDSTNCYEFNGQNGIAFYNWQSDSLLTNNLYHNEMNNSILHCDSSLKRMIQFFNYSMINNKMNIETIRPSTKKMKDL